MLPWWRNWLVSGVADRYRAATTSRHPEDSVHAGVNLAFADNITFNTDVDRAMERAGHQFFKTRYRFFGVVSKLRQFSFGLGGNGGDQIFFDEEHPYLGRDSGWNTFINLRLISQMESRISIDSNRFVDVHSNDALVFDVNIFRTVTTYQFTDRFLLRNSAVQQLRSELRPHFCSPYRVNPHGLLRRLRRPLPAGRPLMRDLDGTARRRSTSRPRSGAQSRAVPKLQYLFRI